METSLTDQLAGLLGSDGEFNDPASVSPQVSPSAPQAGQAPADATQAADDAAGEQPSSTSDWLEAMFAESGVALEQETPQAQAASEQNLSEDDGRLTQEEWNALPDKVKRQLQAAAQDREWREDFNRSLKQRRLESKHAEQRAGFQTWYDGEVEKIEAAAEDQVRPAQYITREMKKLNATAQQWRTDFDASAARAIAKLREIDEQPQTLMRLAQEHGLERQDIQHLAEVHPDDWEAEAAKLATYRAEINQLKGATTSKAATNLAQRYAQEHMVKPAGTGKPRPPVMESDGSDDELDAIVQFSRVARATRKSA